MRPARRILFVSGILFIAIQFISPVHNQSKQVLATDISRVILVPDSVLALLKNAMIAIAIILIIPGIQIFNQLGG
jgi:hypothetical protein